MTPPAKSRMLTDHRAIRRWAEERRGRPAAVRSPLSDDYIGMIRLDFPGYRGEDSLEEISWDEWFEDFDDRNLALIVYDEAAADELNNFHKLVRRETTDHYSEETASSRRGGSGFRSASSPMSESQAPHKTRARGGSSSTRRSGLREEKKLAEPSPSSRPRAA